jgi:hypothetical protein
MRLYYTVNSVSEDWEHKNIGDYQVSESAQYSQVTKISLHSNWSVIYFPEILKIIVLYILTSMHMHINYIILNL